MKFSGKSIALILAGSLLLGGTGAALAYGGGHFGKGGCGHHGGSMHGVKRLDNLSDGQRDQIRAIMSEQREAMRDRKDKMRDSRRALREAMQQGADEATLRPLAEKQGAAVTEMIMARARVRNQIHALLTEEQRQQLEQQRRDRRNGGKDDHRRGHGDRW
ncbi:MAG: Spy/CpxP family protein refolding chaperone [Pseudomonadota bacterium]